MKIAVAGTGYVGLVSGACFAEMGVDVTCVDIDRGKIESIRSGVMPIYEPGLEELVGRNVDAGRLRFTTDFKSSIEGAEIVFLAVGTPPDADGAADMSAVLNAAREFGRYICRYTILVTKSTVPVGSSQQIRSAVEEEMKKRGEAVEFDVAANPEFLKEGAAINDFMSPDRVIVGVDSERAKRVLSRLYRPFLTNNFRVYFMDIPSAELTKYAANAMLATRISFMNDIANLCDLVGADIDMVRKGLGTDTRIGSKFLYAGCGYGGSCFPKDVKALSRTARNHGYRMAIVEAVDDINERQKMVVVDKLRKALGTLAGRRIALWGVAFKPNTDDMRDAPSLVVIETLLSEKAAVVVYDPVAMEECRRRFGDKLTYGKDMYEALVGADAMVLLTEWKTFRMPSWSVMRQNMRQHVVVDGRNIYDKDEVFAEGFAYYAIGK